MVGHGVETKLLLLNGDMLVNCSCEYGEVILVVAAAEEAVAALAAMDFSYFSLIFSATTAADISRPEMTSEPRFIASTSALPTPPSLSGSTRS